MILKPTCLIQLSSAVFGSTFVKPAFNESQDSTQFRKSQFKGQVGPFGCHFLRYQRRKPGTARYFLSPVDGGSYVIQNS